MWLVVNSQAATSRRPPTATSGPSSCCGRSPTLARQSGVAVSLYPHMGCYAERMEDVVRLAKKADRPNVGVTFTFCHFLAVDDAKNLDRVLEMARPYLTMVTINGTSGYDPKNFGRWIQVLGEGTFDVGRRAQDPAAARLPRPDRHHRLRHQGRPPRDPRPLDQGVEEALGPGGGGEVVRKGTVRFFVSVSRWRFPCLKEQIAMSETTTLNRRDFMREATAAGAALGLPVIAPPRCGRKRLPVRPEVAAIYCPSWHRYDHMDAWHGYGWCEWELLKTAPPASLATTSRCDPRGGASTSRTPGGRAREIELAADHGIDVFLFDWYWYSGVRLMEEALENGFLKAPNRARLKFALMWANHDWGDYFPWAVRQAVALLAPAAALARRPGPGDRLLHRPLLPRAELLDRGRPLVLQRLPPGDFIDQLGGPAKTKAPVGRGRRAAAAAGLPPMHWNAMIWDPQQAAQCREAGFRSTTTYNITESGKTRPDLTQEYEDLIEAHTSTGRPWRDTPLPHCPVVTMGWDVTPRCEHDVPVSLCQARAIPTATWSSATRPERFGRLCKLAADFVAADPKQPPAVFVNAWNEWTEGSYLLPEERHGTAYLEGVKQNIHRRRLLSPRSSFPKLRFGTHLPEAPLR